MFIKSLVISYFVLTLINRASARMSRINPDPDEIFELYEKRDYCDITCENLDPGPKVRPYHIACVRQDCRSNYLCKELRMNNTMRREILLEINAFRDSFARGLEVKAQNLKASRMMAMNYDMELEYIARCAHIMCDSLGGAAIDVQNYCTNTLNYGITRIVIIGRYGGDECFQNRMIPNCFKKFIEHYKRDKIQVGLTEKRILNYFALNLTLYRYFDSLHVFLYERADAIGCSCIYEYKRALSNCVCIISMHAFNHYSPLFKIGEPCSECPPFTPCNNKVQTEFNTTFEGLCGTFKFVTYNPNSHSVCVVPSTLVFALLTFLAWFSNSVL